MATLAARLSNTGVYSVAGYFDEVSNIPITYQFNSGLSTGNSFFIDNGNINWPYFNLSAGTIMTTEFWFYAYPTSQSGTNFYSLFSTASNTHISGVDVVLYSTPTLNVYALNITFYNTAGGTYVAYVTTTGFGLSFNTWNHILLYFGHQSGNFEVYTYVNGKKYGMNGTVVTGSYGGDTSTLKIGNASTNFSSIGNFYGEIGGARLGTNNYFFSSFPADGTQVFTPTWNNTMVDTPNTYALFVPTYPDYTNRILRNISTSSLATNIPSLTMTANNVNFITNNLPPGLSNYNTKLYSTGVMASNTTGYFDEVTSNTTTFAATGAPNTKAKIYSSGVFAISNTGYFDEISYPTGSLIFGSGGAVSLNNYGDTYQDALNFGTNIDFTIEGWINLASLASVSATGGLIWGNGSLSSGTVVSASQLIVFSTSTGALTYYYSRNNGTTSGYFGSLSMGTLTTNKWYHFAVTRTGNSQAALISTFLNGTLIASAGGATASTPGAGISSPNAYNLGYFYGNITNFKITRGVSLYYNSFIPSVYPLVADTNTVQLLNTANTLNYDRTFIRYDGTALNKPWFADISNNRFHITGYNLIPGFSANTPFS